ncbi:hypothetical protein [Agromyces neolithicus]|uniref:Uncharacterized protein n=1 Tax=Agromyces neolithicus TaxID=269420 RepID=A0ABN2LUB9_9MICO
MVQPIENRAGVQCRPIGPPRPGPAPEWTTQTVRVERVTELPGWPNLLAEAVGREYTAIVPPQVSPQLAAEAIWNVEAELVGPHRIAVKGPAAEPDPSDEDEASENPGAPFG